MQALVRHLSHLGASSSAGGAGGVAAAAARRALASAAGGSSGGNAFNAALLPFVVCPLSKTPLRYDAAANELVSDELGVAYPIRNGIPRLISTEGRLLHCSDSSSCGGGGGGAAADSGSAASSGSRPAGGS